MRRWMFSAMLCAAIVTCRLVPASAQVLGTFSWQLQPYCNTLALRVTQSGDHFTLDGYDSQCGAPVRAAVTGIAMMTAGGDVNMGLTVVTTPGGAPVHIDATINLGTLSGSWSDSMGFGGTYVFGGVGNGPPVRPLGASLITKYNNSPVIIARRVNGTPTAPTPAIINNILATFQAEGFDGGSVSSAVEMRATATENWTAGAHGAKLALWTTPNGNTGPTPRMTVDQNGRVGIGTTAPLNLLDVVGDIRVGVGTSGCIFDRDGDLIAGGCPSDVRFKRDIISFEPMLGKVASLRPVHFFWRADEFPERAFGERQSYGLIAQEVEQVLPDLVKTDADGYKAVNYSKLPLIALQAIKELKDENEALKTQNAQFEQRLAALEARLASSANRR